MLTVFELIIILCWARLCDLERSYFLQSLRSFRYRNDEASATNIVPDIPGVAVGSLVKVNLVSPTCERLYVSIINDSLYLWVVIKWKFLFEFLCSNDCFLQ